MDFFFFIHPLNLILSCYFFGLVLATILKSYLTVRGLFFFFSSLLGFILYFLLVYFDAIFLYNCIFSNEFLLVYQTSLLPELGVSFYLDNLAYCFVLLVVLIGFFTNIYILNYFKFEANEDSFFLLIN